MITIADIIKILFADEKEQGVFINHISRFQPPIVEQNIEEQLTYFFNNASNRDLQLVLAPYLRARLFKYLYNEETPYAKNFKKEFIRVIGAELFHNSCDASVYRSVNREVKADFSNLKKSFIYKRGNDIWNTIYDLVENDNNCTSHYFEQYSRSKQYFFEAFEKANFAEFTQEIRKKMPQIDDFIKQYETNAGNAANSLLTQALTLAHQLKSSFIQEVGEEQWSIVSPLVSPQRVITASLESLVEADNLDYSAIRVKSQELFTTYKNIFIDKWGSQEWDNYLNTHKTDGAYATDEQLKILAKIFNFRVQVTDINSTRQTCIYFLDNEEGSNAPIIHFYCESNTHYYIHKRGSSETIGNGNCFYNGFAQWLRLLVQGQQPRRINEAENRTARISHQSTYSRAVYNDTAEPEEDWLSAGLCIAGIFMIIASIIFMISLLLVATLSGLSGLGLFLMQHGMASIALSLGAVIGLSAPHTAILLATGASFITAGVGFTFFKDFAPSYLPSLDSFLPNLYLFSGATKWI